MAQMAVVHLATMTFTRRLAHVDNIPQQDSAQNALNKLMRTFTNQMETLIAQHLKNPPVVYAKQANIAHGPQQVNNAPLAPRARKKIQIGQTNFWNRAMKSPWTPERRARQATAIQRWKPWEKSTGPRTDEGKAIVSRNAFKGGKREALRRSVREFRQFMKVAAMVLDEAGAVPR